MHVGTLDVFSLVRFFSKPNDLFTFVFSSSDFEEVTKGNCTCGGFPSIVIESDSQPLISQSPGLEVKCDDDGESTCKQLCIALATAAKAKGPEVLCTRLKRAEELKVSIPYFKAFVFCRTRMLYVVLLC